MVHGGPSHMMPQHPRKPPGPLIRPSPSLPQPLAILEGSEVGVSGFSEAPEKLGPYVDYDLVTTKRALLHGLRHHVLRFASKRDVDLTDQRQFLRPVRLQRRDPRYNPGGIDDGAEAENEDEKEEREKREKAREEREKQREADALLVAPSVDKPAQRRVPFGKRVQPVYRNNQTEAQKVQSKLKYEETLPWHLEDDENKNVWIGSYEQALSGEYAAFALGADNKFRMIPIEKWYRFTPKNKNKIPTIEEAERTMGKLGAKVRRGWTTKEMEEQAKDAKKEEDEMRRLDKRLLLSKKAFTGKVGSIGGGPGRPSIKAESENVDDLDFEEDRFADDEEAPVMEGVLDDEEKEREKKIKHEQLEANIFDMRDEKDYELEERKQHREKRQLKETGKRVKKAIVRREKNLMYDSAEENPYTTTEVGIRSLKFLYIWLITSRARPKIQKPSI